MAEIVPMEVNLGQLLAIDPTVSARPAEDRQGAAAAQIAAHQTREAKLAVSHDEMQRRHRELADWHDRQPDRVIEAAAVRKPALEHREPDAIARTAVTFARDRNLEREAVVEERAVLRDALQRSLGESRLDDLKREVERRVQTEELIAVDQKAGTPGRSFTTAAMIELERDTINTMVAGKEKHSELATEAMRESIVAEYQHLNENQQRVVDQILRTRDQVTALEGTAGTGKTTTLAAVRDAAEREGYQVEGFAPTSRAAQKLSEAGIASTTLQRHLARNAEEERPNRHLYVLDESSLASTKQMHAFLNRLGAEDRVLLVGDVRQHEAVDAGRPYRQLQEAGIQTARLDEIVRQEDPALKSVVERLSRGDVRAAVEQLDEQRRVHEIPRRAERLSQIADEYVKHPTSTLVVSPDNQSRQDINRAIHSAMQREGHVAGDEHRVRVLVPRQDITGTDRQCAERYEAGDVLRYSKGSRTIGIDAGAYARIERIDQQHNHVTVQTDDGRKVTYDPRRLQGVTVFQEADRSFSRGERVQVTAPDRARDVANRELGAIARIEKNGRIDVELDSGRVRSFAPGDRRHLDYGYAVTSHSSQGQTADRVLVHVETDRAGEKLVNRRLAYVAVSRGRHDAHIYTDDKRRLGHVLERDVSHRSALESGTEPTSSRRTAEREVSRSGAVGQMMAAGRS